jgi:hypothetical protein
MEFLSSIDTTQRLWPGGENPEAYMGIHPLQEILLSFSMLTTKFGGNTGGLWCNHLQDLAWVNYSKFPFDTVKN